MYFILFIGFLGQFLFFLRFLVQWLYSEKKGESVIPVSFWYFSIVGALLILVYSIFRKDPVFIAGQGVALLIYSRNLMLLGKKKRIINKIKSSSILWLVYRIMCNLVKNDKIDYTG